MFVFGLFWIPDFLVCILVLFVALYIYGTWTFSSLAAHGYKGPKPKFLLGNMDLLFSKGHFGGWDLIGKREYGKVFAMFEGRQPTIVVFDTDIIKQVLVKEFANFTHRRDLILRGDIMRHSLIDIGGEEWKRIRSLCSPFFTTGKLKRNTLLLQSCVNHLKARFDQFAKTGEEFEIKDVIGAFTLESICLTAFGLDIDSQNDPDHAVLQSMKRLQNMGSGNWGIWLVFMLPFCGPILDRLGIDMWPKGSMETFCQVTKVAIEDRKKSGVEKPDFIQAMIKAEQDFASKVTSSESNPNKSKTLSDKEIIAQASLFLFAGFDTVSTALSFLLFNLANNPKCQDRVLAEINDVIGANEMTYDNLKEMTYLDMCLEESLRLYPPGLRGDRMCEKDITINGHFIPKGTLVVFPIYALHHDPEYWNDPDTFDPERFSSENRSKIDPYAYQAFGTGPRNCVGMRLAQIEVKMAAICLIKHFKITVGKKTTLPIELTGGIFPKADGGLWLTVTNR